MTEPRRESASTPVPPPLSIADALGIMLLAVILLAVGYVRSRDRMFWADEIMGHLTLCQPTWSGLLRYWRAGLDSSGIWYYVFARPWGAVFGFDERSLRMFSAAGIALSAALVWITARRFYSILPVAASIALVYSSTSTLRWQLSNGRTYGVFMAASALVLYLLFRGEDNSARRPSPLFLLATFAAYSLLTGSHILGALYTAAFLGMQMLLDLKARRFRPTLYLAAAASFVVVLVSRANLQATAALGKPSFWTIRPAIHQLIALRIITDPRVRHIVLAVLMLALFSFRGRLQRMPVYVVLAGFLSLNVLMFEISRHATSIYVDRYLMPFAFAFILVICELLTQLREADLRFHAARFAVPAVVLLIALWTISHPDINEPWIPYPNYTTDLLQSLPPGLTAIDTDPESFFELHFYHPDGLGHAVLYAIDWPVALEPINSGGVSGVNELANFKALGIYPGSIDSTSQVLAQVISQNRDFLVLGHSLWFDRRILTDPRFVVTHLGTYPTGWTNLDIWQIHTR